MISLGSRKLSFGQRAGFVPGGAPPQDRKSVRERMAASALRPVQTSDQTSGAGAPSPETTEAAALLDLLPNAAVLIDGDLRIVQVNRAAEALLAESDSLVTIRKDGGPQLAVAASAENRRLRAALASAVSTAEGNEGGGSAILRVSCASDRRTLIFIVTPLPPERFPLWASVGRDIRAMVRIVDPHASVAMQVKVLQQAFGLTRAESRVLALVAEGLTRPKVAELLNLSPNTVRSHLGSCFDKTGVRSQVALVRLIASITGGAPDF